MHTTAVGILLAFVASAPAEETPRSHGANVACVQDLLKMDKCQLLELYHSAVPGPVPSGYAPGRVLPNPGKRSNEPISKIVQATIWQGKHFDADGMMTNKQFGVRTNKGHVYGGPSILDGKPVHIIDYYDSWRVWRPFFDEFREVSPGIYLGITWRIDGPCPKFFTYFAIDARKGCCQSFEAK